MRTSRFLLATAALLAACAPARGLNEKAVAVFNFQLKKGPDEWVWLEKFLADQLTIDFHRAAGIAVVARDKMQETADRMSWTPELARDAGKMGHIRQWLRIHTLITGLCEIDRDRLTLTALVVDVASRRELHRVTVAGRLDEVLTVQKRLSAKLLSWFTKLPPEKILPELPVWTRSIPAVKALYEGMDLYDRGHYPAAWLKFRRASREDPAYVEATYWVGKMYYFMNRYEHARRAIERFMYMDRTHPRLGDAVTEYVHTYERQGATTDELVALYRNLAARLPDARAFKRWPHYTKLPHWLAWRISEVLLRADRHAPAIDALRGISRLDISVTGAFGGARGLANRALLGHHLRTGRQYEPWMYHLMGAGADRHLAFGPGRSRREVPLPDKVRIRGAGRRDDDEHGAFAAGHVERTLLCTAPQGHVFRRLTIHLRAEGRDGTLSGRIRAAAGGQHVLTEFRTPLSEAVEGIVVDKPPPLGTLLVQVRARAGDGRAGEVTVRGFALEALTGPVGEHGMIAVTCDQTPSFRIVVDSRPCRHGPGVVGLLSPGPHEVEVAPLHCDSPFAPWKGAADVRTGQVTPVVARMTLRPDGPWAGWREAALPQAYDRPPIDTPADLIRGPKLAMQIDDGAVRLVWCYLADLWYALSTDGRSFSRPRKLDLPVSSAWIEDGPFLYRDETGRFMLMLNSNRDGRHMRRPYLCWSRDMVRFSAPAVMHDTGGAGVLADQTGRLIFRRSRRLYATRDGTRVTELGRDPWHNYHVPHRSGAAAVRRDDGRLEMLVLNTRAFTAGVDRPKYHTTVRRHLAAADGRRWSKAETVAEFLTGVPLNRVAAVHADGRTRALIHGSAPRTWSYRPGAWCRAQAAVVVEQSDGSWLKSRPFAGFHNSEVRLGRHRRWGLVLARHTGTRPRSTADPGPAPRVLVGGSLEAMARRHADRSGPPDLEDLKPRVGDTRDIVRHVVNGNLVSMTVWDRRPPDPGEGPKPPRHTAPDGVISYAAFAGHGHRIGRVRIPPDRLADARGRGLVHPKAVTGTFHFGPHQLAVAVDARKPDAVRYDVLRIDLTGERDFTDAIEIPRANYTYEPARKKYTYSFCAEEVDLRLGGRRVRVRFRADYARSPTERGLTLWATTRGRVVCRFGRREDLVGLYDADGDLLFNTEGTDRVRAGGCEVPLGRPVWFNGGLYVVRTSPDGTRARTEKYAGPTGKIHFPHDTWVIYVTDDHGGRLDLRAGREPITVPAGKYRFLGYRVWVKSRGGKLDSRMQSQAGLTRFEVPEGRTVRPRIGPPADVSLTAKVDGRRVTFRLDRRDAGGHVVGYSRSDQPVYSTVSAYVTDADNRKVGQFTFEPDRRRTVVWRVPAGVAGRLTATLSPHMIEFGADPAKVGFTVGP